MPLVDQILPFRVGRSEISTYRARIEQRESEHAKGAPLVPIWRKYRALSMAELEASLRSDLSRRDGIFRRGLAYLGSVAVLSAFTFGVVRALADNAGPLTAPLCAMSVLVVAFLGTAGWSALQIVKPELVYDLFLQARVPGDHPLQDDDLKDEVIYEIHMNQALCLIFSEHSKRAYRCLRNGLVSLLLVAGGLLYTIV